MFKLEATKKKFEFEYDGKEYSLPSLNCLPAKVGLSLARISDEQERITASNEMLMDIIEENCKGLIDKLTMKELEELINAWSEESGITLGE